MTHALVRSTSTTMDLIVNGTASIRSSLGARRYYAGVMEYLQWQGAIEITPMPRFPKLERISELMQRGRSDAIFWSPSHRGPLRAHHHVITVLDCINVEYTYQNDWRLPLFRRLFQQVLDHAQFVVTISKATRDAVKRNYAVDPSKIVVIAGPADLRGGVQTQILSPAHSTSLTAHDRPFVLMVTNALPHKNTIDACRALARSAVAQRGFVLRVVGSLAPQALAACCDAGLTVQLHRGVDDATLADWYARSAFLFSPSFDEGLNLPVAEALSSGGNVLCSDIPVHREFYDGSVKFFDPHSAASMTDAIDEACTHEGSWGQTASLTPRPTFRDVALGYRSLFQRIAADAALTAPMFQSAGDRT